jgi:hypothetical protein
MNSSTPLLIPPICTSPTPGRRFSGWSAATPGLTVRGDNSGKTTLLCLLAGELKRVAGSRWAVRLRARKVFWQDLRRTR